MGCIKSSTKREVYSKKSIHQKGKSQMNNLTFHLMELEKKKNKLSPKLAEERK